MRTRLVAIALGALTLAACGTTALPRPTGGGGEPSGPTAIPSAFVPGSNPGGPTAVPGGPGGGTSGGGGTGRSGSGGSGSGSSTGGWSGPGVITAPVTVGPDQGPGTPMPTMVVPSPGQRDPQPVNVRGIKANVDGRHVSVLLTWWSGMAPCTVLDSVLVERSGDRITLTAREGSDPNAGEVACIEIAQFKGTVVDLGDLAPGTWTIATTGDTAPIQVAVR